jgi:glutaredoxin-like protein
MLQPEDRAAIQQRLQSLQDPVRLVHFTQVLGCESCRDTQKLLEEVAALSGKLALEVHNFPMERERAAVYGIERVPATVIEGTKDHGIRIYGLPVGFEFAVLLQSMVNVSRGESGLDPDAQRALTHLQAPVRVQVFSTPGCPYCPGMGVLAHQMAMESEWVTAEVIDATEYPELVRQFDIRGVPRTIVNGKESIEGLVEAPVLLEAVLRAGTESLATQGRTR